MKESDTEETFFKEIMLKSKLEVPFSDFDDKVMGLIKKRHSQNASISRDLKLSWIFFILGSTFGIAVSIILTQIQEPIMGIQLSILRIPLLIIFAFLLMTHFDSLIDYYKGHKIQTKR